VTEHSRWPTIERLYHAAVERNATERHAFLTEACAGDEALRREVESLLAHERTADGLFAATALEVAATTLGDDAGDALVGHSFGGYQVVSALGAGGMGEVYRAHDATLARDVAIKVLPQLFTADSERLARFEQEARMLAALNHPHIGAIYGVEHENGVRGLVLELVEGSTLAERIASGPLPVPEALGIARQIADALDAAHEKGIIHRDLKPANIKITPGGIVKVLDFGLAKTATDESRPGPCPSSTVTVGRTSEGLVLGTAAYMSPEQARGQVVDKRTDIWAFGCVLYELLTGRQPFSGETVADTIAMVLGHEPDWNRLPSNTPLRAARLVRHCLDKDLSRRLPDIADVLIELDELPSVALRPHDDNVADRVPATPARRRWPYVASGGLLAAATTLMVGLWMRSPAGDTGRLPAMTLRQITANPSEDAAYHGAISPDGRYMAYTDLEGLHLRLIETGETHLLPIADDLCFR
jgi:eukaryotic-like serine/threonine-protein kinase